MEILTKFGFISLLSQGLDFDESSPEGSAERSQSSEKEIRRTDDALQKNPKNDHRSEY